MIRAFEYEQNKCSADGPMYDIQDRQNVRHFTDQNKKSTVNTPLILVL